MKLKRKYLVIFLPVIVLWLCGVCCASAHDLEISLAVADENSAFGRTLEVLGEPPAILFTSFNFAILTAYQLRCTGYTLKNKLLAALFAVMSVGLPVYTNINTVDYYVKRADEIGRLIQIDLAIYIIYGFAALLVTVLFALIAFTMSDKTLRRIGHIAVSCTAAAVTTFFVIWIFKLCWGRVRFRDLADAAAFTPWYLPQGFTGNYSFPSGHTANATVIISTLHYMTLLPIRLRFIKPIACAILTVWIAAVAFSRVCVGAHYLSDVLFGMAITLVIVFLTRPRKSE